jgi:hypothetical protein
MGRYFLFEVKKNTEVLQKNWESFNVDALYVFAVNFFHYFDDGLLGPLQVFLLAESKKVTLVHVSFLFEVVFLNYFGTGILRENFLDKI